MIGILREQHVPEQARSRESAINGPRGRPRLHDPVAGIAAQLGPYMAQNPEAGADVLQRLGHISAQFAQPPP